MSYRVAKSDSSEVTADWQSPIWHDIKPLELTYHLGERPKHFPNTQAKLRYDDQALYVIFRVEDRYVRAVAPRHQADIWHDSCAEFFFSPTSEVSTAFMNIEMNCGGTMLFHYQTAPGETPTKLTSDDISEIEVAHSQPKIVEPEITEPTVWTIAYRLPFELIAKYYPSATRPAAGVRWRANFYKCADKTSHPHWLTWNEVDHPSPNFHLPQFFGTLEFE